MPPIMVSLSLSLARALFLSLSRQHCYVCDLGVQECSVLCARAKPGSTLCPLHLDEKRSHRQWGTHKHTHTQAGPGTQTQAIRHTHKTHTHTQANTQALGHMKAPERARTRSLSRSRSLALSLARWRALSDTHKIRERRGGDGWERE